MKAFTAWFTGLPSSGKTTLANLLHRELLQKGIVNAELFDGDVVRTHLSKGLGFSKADRDTNILRIGWVCQLLTKHGVSNIVAAISPYREARNEVRAMVEKVGGEGSFVEIWVRCPVEQCMKRDAKGLYAKALAGKLPNFTGISDPYEEPLDADVIVNTKVETPTESLNKVLRLLEKRM